MTRVLSGVFLGVVALALIWFLDSIWLLSVALVVCALAFQEYERIVDRIGAKVPYWSSLTATLLACTMVPFEWFDIESVLAAALLVVALNVLASRREGAPLLTDTAAAMLAPVYLGLPLGSLVGVHAIAGREAVVLLIATVGAPVSMVTARPALAEETLPAASVALAVRVWPPSPSADEGVMDQLPPAAVVVPSAVAPS